MNQEDLVNIQLSKKELKLLKLLLEDLVDIRSDMDCNDPYKKELKLFTKKERMIYQENVLKKHYDDYEIDGYLYNTDYVEIILDKIISYVKANK